MEKFWNGTNNSLIIGFIPFNFQMLLNIDQYSEMFTLFLIKISNSVNVCNKHYKLSIFCEFILVMNFTYISESFCIYTS